jgi:hypothetical protein
MKHPSPEVNPATQLGSKHFGSLTKGLKTGIVLGKAFFNVSVRPLFIEALIFIICCKPSLVKCFLFSTKRKACLNN